jgi:hypothetical protein
VSDLEASRRTKLLADPRRAGSLLNRGSRGVGEEKADGNGILDGVSSYDGWRAKRDDTIAGLGCGAGVCRSSSTGEGSLRVEEPEEAEAEAEVAAATAVAVVCAC